MGGVVKLLKEKPTLVFVGQLKSGKSTLANMILQHHILPSDEGPCTARMVKLKYETESSPAYLEVLKVDGTSIGERIFLDTTVDSRGFPRLLIPPNIVEVGRGTSYTERFSEFRDDKGHVTEHGAWVELSYPHPLLQFIQIVDSPGKGENDSLDRLVNDEVCNGLVQTLVYVIDGCRGLTTQDKIDLKSIKNQLTENSRGKGKICFVCTRIDEALKEDPDEPPPTFSLDQLPSDSNDSEEDDHTVDSGQPDESDTLGSDKDDVIESHEICSTLKYSTRIHERVFSDLVDEGFLDDLEQDQLQSHDKCDFFHCVSAYAAAHFSREDDGEDENPFLRDFLQFEKSLAKVIVDNLNAHVKDALEELISKQTLLIEIMFQTKFSLARKAMAAEQQLQFIVKTEERVYKHLREVVATSRLSQLQEMINAEKAVSLQSLPEKAGEMVVFSAASHISREDQDKTAANQVREYVCDKFNDNFKRRVRDHTPVLNVGETVERCAETMQSQVGQNLEAVRLVSTVVQAAYRPLSNALSVKKGLPLKLRIQNFFNAVLRRDPAESYTKSWKEGVARDFIKSLDAKALAEEYCAEVEQTLERAHAEFKLSIEGLEAAKQSIVNEALGQQREVRIKDGYELAAVFLQSKSFLDSLRHGIPQKGEEIGAGPTSIVYKCLEGQWGQRADVVVKVRKPWPPQVSREVWPASLYFSTECLDYKNIQKAIGFLVPPAAPEDEIWVLEEACLCSLEDVLQGTTQLGTIPWLEIGMNAVDGLLHLFCQGIPHHNIKPSNILLSGSCEAKLCDMGMYDIATMKANNVTRAVYFVAPELATSETEGVATTDVYSIGILLWYLFKGHSVVKEPGKAVPDPNKYSTCGSSCLAVDFFQMVCDPEVLLRPELNEWSSKNHSFSKVAALMQRCWHHDSSERLDCGSLKDEFQRIKEELSTV
jgi:hypothetical protein